MHQPPMVQPPAPSFSQPAMPQSPYFSFASQPGPPYSQFPPHPAGLQGMMDFTQTPGQYPLHAQQSHQYLQNVLEAGPTPTLVSSIRTTVGSHNAVLGDNNAIRGSERSPSVAPSAPSPSPIGIASAAPGAERPTLQNASQSSATTKPSTSSTGRAPPGTLSLPSQAFSIPNPMSPHLTRGLPPMTPSMPGFTFHAPPVSWSLTFRYQFINLFSLILSRGRRHQLLPTSCHLGLAHSRPR